jgi:hypothetical protein
MNFFPSPTPTSLIEDLRVKGFLYDEFKETAVTFISPHNSVKQWWSDEDTACAFKESPALPSNTNRHRLPSVSQTQHSWRKTTTSMSLLEFFLSKAVPQSDYRRSMASTP